jgi:hypothetical protein
MAEENFAATMTDEERAAFAAHAQWLGRLLADGATARAELRPYQLGFLRGRDQVRR